MIYDLVKSENHTILCGAVVFADKMRPRRRKIILKMTNKLNESIDI